MSQALFPRFISYADSDLQEVTSVLRKLITCNQPKLASIQ